jgi:ElaB/YqjD/DUF883 family membrane-anchored ribosome-binding protein
MSPFEPTPEVPTRTLEEHAIEQRRRLHNTVSELREQVRDTVREKLDVHRYASEYAWPAAAAAAFIGLVFGFGTGGIFKSHG